MCSDETGHAEVVQLEFDPSQISYDQLLNIFWSNHNPTTLNRQGPDMGTQYRSAIFYTNDAQKEAAIRVKEKVEKSGKWKRSIVTEITKFKTFFPAEKYHQDYFNANPAQRYCQFVIRPKVEKFNKDFKNLLKDAPAH